MTIAILATTVALLFILARTIRMVRASRCASCRRRPVDMYTTDGRPWCARCYVRRPR